ncbi:MAG TPA: hypothetical protein PKI19_05005 [Elusimicrobiales bacterium]|nr:hypothetical protein [Elusimicrobiales bacterium]
MTRTGYIVVAVVVALLLGWQASRKKQETSLATYEPLPPITVQNNAQPGAPGNGAAAPQPAAAATERPAASPAAVAGSRAAQPAAPAPNPAAEAAARLAVLEEILSSKNDNDPRLDSAFNDLSPQAKRLFIQKYRQLPAESRNERGTVVYLLGRNLKTAEDWQFMQAVVGEPPCLSLENCSRAMKAEPGHVNTGVEVTLAYPAIMALKRAERVLQAGTGDAGQALQLISAARNSRSKAVSSMAAELEQQFSGAAR